MKGVNWVNGSESGEDAGWSVMKAGYNAFRHFLSPNCRRFLFNCLFYSTPLFSSTLSSDIADNPDAPCSSYIQDMQVGHIRGP